MLATLTSAALVGIDAVPVQVEVNANERGEPRLILLGLPDAAVKESANRVHSALAHCGFAALRTRTTVNLAPGALRKEGALYDLPIALALLAASRQLQLEIADDCLIAGELSLSGSTRPIRGALAIARLAKRMGKRLLLLPGISADEAALVDGISVQRIDALGDACQLLSGGPAPPAVAPLPLAPSQPNAGDSDFSEVKGQRALRRAIEVACSGAHNLLMLCLFHPFRTADLSFTERRDLYFLFANRKYSVIAKSQDVVVALALVSLNREHPERLQYGRLAGILGMSSSEAFKATRRLIAAGLVEPGGWRPLRGPLCDYILHGVPHAFPGKLGEPTRGVPTAWAALPLASSFPQGSDLPPVWPCPDGRVRGYSVEPLFRSVPEAIKNLPSLYESLALVDALRIGRARDREIAREMLKTLLLHDPSLAH